ncbi:MAG: MGMT family protein [candidate division WOR-3 bacterium]
MKDAVVTRRTAVRGFPVAVTRRNGVVVEVSLRPKPGRNDPELGREIERVLESGVIPGRLRVDLSGLPEFTRRVLRTCARIRPGRTMTYAELARKAGRPRAARAVGQVMARNPFPLLIPCHRVVRSDGSPGGYVGGQTMKQKLLAAESRPGRMVLTG